jgi:hypothetical protein
MDNVNAEPREGGAKGIIPKGWCNHLIISALSNGGDGM